jgi:hypothetical protein
MQTLEKLYESVFEHITDPDFVRFIDEPEVIEPLTDKDIALLKKGGKNVSDSYSR